LLGVIGSAITALLLPLGVFSSEPGTEPPQEGAFAALQRRTQMIRTTVLLVFALAIAAAPAWAQNPQFNGTPSCTISGSGTSSLTLTACSKITGLGNDAWYMRLEPQTPSGVTCQANGQGQTTSAKQKINPTAIPSGSSGTDTFCTTTTFSCPGNQIISFSGGSISGTLILSATRTGTAVDSEPVTCQ
jgi:hypothetical protein